MSLIKCPKCGGSISDSAINCVHCGFDFIEEKKRVELSKEYTLLPKEEKDRIRKEYDNEFPEFKNVENKYYKCLTASIVAWSVTIVAIIVFFIMRIVSAGGNKGEAVVAVGIVSIIIVLIFLVVSSILSVIISKLSKCRLKCKKKFQEWLIDKKQITYTIVLTEKERKAFNKK